LLNAVAPPKNGVVEMHVLLGALVIGAGVGFLSGAFGKGGSALSTPLLHVLGVPAIVAIASPPPGATSAAGTSIGGCSAPDCSSVCR
jgi:uncharacterized membrane protein YfcA